MMGGLGFVELLVIILFGLAIFALIRGYLRRLALLPEIRDLLKVLVESVEEVKEQMSN